MNLADKAVFPIFGKTLAQCDPQTGAVTVLGGTGMTLLEHYAGLAMQGLLGGGLATGNFRINNKPANNAAVAEMSVDLARALIAELEKEQQA